MIPALLLPGALAALVALAIPLVIHVARRSEQRPTDFAALRWLRPRPRPRSRLRLDEWPLLLLRLVLLALLALWLARPAVYGAADETAYVAVVPGAEATIDKAARAHWLAPGFPLLDEPGPDARVPVASLIRQLDAELPAGTPLTVIVPQLLQGADAERPRLSRNVDWRVAPGAMPAAQPAALPVPPLAIRHDAGHAAALRYLRAAAIAWQPAGRDADIEIGTLDAALPKDARGLVWLAEGTLPAALTRWVEGGGTALVVADALVPGNAPRAVAWRDDLGRPLVEAAAMGKGRLLRFTRRLAPAEMPELLEPDFPARLRALLDPAPPPPARVAAGDYAPAPGGRAYDQPPRDLRPWLAVLIAVLLLAERWLATRRSRGTSP